MEDSTKKSRNLLVSEKYDHLPSLARYRNEWLEYLSGDYEFHLREDFSWPPIRYLHYYEKDHTLLVANTSNGSVMVINLNTGSSRIFNNHNTTVRKIAVLKNRIITASWDGTICLSDYYTLKPQMILSDKHMGRCPYFNITADQRFLLSFTYDSDKIPGETGNVLRKWSLKTGKVLQKAPASHEMYSSCKSGSILIHKNRIYTCSDSGYFKVFDSRRYDTILQVKNNINFRTMTAFFDYNYILASDWNGNMHFFNIRSNRFERQVKCHTGDLYCIRRHPGNPEVVITASSNGTVKFWQLPAFVEISSILTGSIDLWSMVFINGHLVMGNINGNILVYEISDPENVVYKGSMALSGNRFVAFPALAGSFYTNDLSSLELHRKSGDRMVDPRESEYILGKLNNIKALKELFGQLDERDRLLVEDFRFLPQLSESLL